MPGLSVLLRVAPFLVGAIAAAVWVKRRQGAPERLELAAPVPAPVVVPELQQGPPHEPVDIVTVVDDLLLVGR